MYGYESRTESEQPQTPTFFTHIRRLFYRLSNKNLQVIVCYHLKEIYFFASSTPIQARAWILSIRYNQIRE